MNTPLTSRAPIFINVGTTHELCRFPETGEWSLRVKQPDDDVAHVRYLDNFEAEMVEAVLAHREPTGASEGRTPRTWSVEKIERLRGLVRCAGEGTYSLEVAYAPSLIELLDLAERGLGAPSATASADAKPTEAMLDAAAEFKWDKDHTDRENHAGLYMAMAAAIDSRRTG